MGNFYGCFVNCLQRGGGLQGCNFGGGIWWGGGYNVADFCPSCDIGCIFAYPK